VSAGLDANGGMDATGDRGASSGDDASGGADASGADEASSADDASSGDEASSGDDAANSEDAPQIQDASSQADVSTVVDAGGAQDSGGPADGGSSLDAEAADAVGGCSMVGTWTGTYSCTALSGIGYTWVIRSDGTATGTIQGSGTVQQTWSVSGDTMTIADIGTTCASAGTYALAFDASCGQVKLTEISDPCAGRAPCVNGLLVTRQ
jgi:hypothetical protein